MSNHQKEKKKFNMPDTYIIIFFVVLIAALLTYIVPQGSFEMEDVNYLHNGEEKTRTVPVEGSFHYELDENGEPLKEGVKFFEPYGGLGFINYMFEGLVSAGGSWWSGKGDWGGVLAR